MMRFIDRKKYLTGLFYAYVIFMLWLLFARHSLHTEIGYWEDIRKSFNGIPFHSIRQYLSILFFGTGREYYLYAFVNFFGNILLFVPMGFLCPVLYKKTRNLLRFLPTFVFGIFLVEILQLFTLRGSCDVDDILLNTFGVLLGWIFWRKLDLEQKRKGGSTKTGRKS